MMDPNFFIIGGPKCGTTALYTYLAQHPEVFMTTPKEPHYFSPEYEMWRQGGIKEWDAYQALFANADPNTHKNVGEASVHYFSSSQAIQSISDTYPDAKLIVMLRNPIDMTYSYYKQNIQSGMDQAPSFVQAWDTQEERSQGSDKDGRKRLLNYKHVGSLGSHYERLISIFPKEQIKHIVFDDFRADTEKCYREVLRFLEIDESFEVDLNPVNQNTEVRSRWLQYITFMKTPKTIWKVTNALGIRADPIRRLVRNMNSSTIPRVPLEPEFRARLREEFKPEVEKLSKLIDRDLQNWV